MGFLAEHSLTLVGVVSAIILVSSFSASFLLDQEEISFTVDDDSIMNDVEVIVRINTKMKFPSIFDNLFHEVSS